MDFFSTPEPGILPVPYLAAAGGEPGDKADPGAGDGSDAQARTQPLVLLVEDNHINQVVALEFLSLMGVQAKLAVNGMEALSACEQEAPDLVLMDIQMPGMDGLECSRRLRELQQAGKLPPFPILALTAHALESDVHASMAAGMDEHLTKPLDFVSLRKHLGRWLKLPKPN
ncbi:MAG TPA: response regulator [Burkholderiaceae bacterium]|jgi:CheY-like chemotaxis protein